MQPRVSICETPHDYFAKRIERARRFVWSLTYNAAQNAPVRACRVWRRLHAHDRALVVERDGPRRRKRRRPTLPSASRPRLGSLFCLMLEPGDGEVPSLRSWRSVAGPHGVGSPMFSTIGYAFFLCVTTSTSQVT